MSKSDKLKVAILGAGSIGCYVGGQLTSAGIDVVLIGRERMRGAIQTHGLTLSHFSRPTRHIAATDLAFSLTPEGLSGADIILVCVKSHDTETTAKAIAQYGRADALIISLQNGMTNADVLRARLPKNPILGAVVPFNVTSKSPGHFHCGSEGDLIIEDNASITLLALQAAFMEAGQKCRLVEDIKSVQWGKLLVNLNNALNALSGITLYQGLMQKKFRRALALTIEEALNIMHGANITPAQFGKASPEKMITVLRLPNFIYQLIKNRILKIDKTARSSMLNDLEAGRKPEIEYLQGEIVRLANETGQSAPINAAIAYEIKSIFNSGSSPRMSGADILHLVETARNTA